MSSATRDLEFELRRRDTRAMASDAAVEYKGYTITEKNGRWHIVPKGSYSARNPSSYWTVGSVEEAKREIDATLKVSGSEDGAADVDEPYWTYKGANRTPRVEDLPPGAFNGTQAEFEQLSPGMRREIERQALRAKKPAEDAGGVRIIFNKLLGGWYVVRGPHDTPISGRFSSKEEAQAFLERQKAIRDNRGAQDADKWIVEFRWPGSSPEVNEFDNEKDARDAERELKQEGFRVSVRKKSG